MAKMSALWCILQRREGFYSGRDLVMISGLGFFFRYNVTYIYTNWQKDKQSTYVLEFEKMASEKTYSQTNQHWRICNLSWRGNKSQLNHVYIHKTSIRDVGIGHK